MEMWYFDENGRIRLYGRGAGTDDELNEAAFESCDQPLTDGENPIAIDAQVYQEVVA